MPIDAPLTTGMVLVNRYRIVKLLGRGGFGAVYRAWDTRLNIPCAVKENFDATPDASRQFTREASILGSLNHPNLPRVTDHFSVPGQGQYLVMDFVEGEDLQTILDQTGGPAPEAQALSWIAQVCDALNYLHSQQPPIIHRDIKPANIRITPQGKAMLVDFGIAKVYDPLKRTTQGARAVTPGFAPFEQYGQKPTDARSDIYALGATLYAALTGQTPPESIDRVAGADLQPPRKLNPAISPAIERAILQAMALQPPQRFANAVEFKTALHRLPGPIEPIQTIFPMTGGLPTPAQYTAVQSIPIPEKAPTRRIWMIGGVAAGGLMILLVLAVVGVIAALILRPKATATVAAVNLSATVTPLAAVAITPTPSQASMATETSLPTPTTTGTQIPIATPTPTLTPRPANTSTPTYTFTPPPTATFTPSPTSTPEPLPAYSGGDTIQSPVDGMILVYIPAFGGFWIDRTEVTTSLYARCVSAGICSRPAVSTMYDLGPYYGEPAFASYPVVYVSWYQAKTYCEWAGRRLPTSDEWQAAAQGADGRAYPWGNGSVSGTRTNICDVNCSLAELQDCPFADILIDIVNFYTATYSGNRDERPTYGSKCFALTEQFTTKNEFSACSIALKTKMKVKSGFLGHNSRKSL